MSTRISPCTVSADSSANASQFCSSFSRQAIFNEFIPGVTNDSEDEVIVFGKPSQDSPEEDCSNGKSKQTKQCKPRKERARILTARFKCTYCEKPYKLRGALDRHIRKKHLDDGGQVRVDSVKWEKKPLIPKTKKKRTSIRHAQSISLQLGSPVKLDNGKTAFECNVCGKHLSQTNLYRHARTHQSPIDLTESPEKSPAKTNGKEATDTPFSTPKRSTTMTASYKCQTCERVFSQKANLRRHEASTHSGLKRFKCRWCGKCVTSKQSLKKHEKIHIKKFNPAESGKALFERLNIQWSCKFCGRNDFANWDAMDDHRLSEHPILTSQIRYEGFEEDGCSNIEMPQPRDLKAKQVQPEVEQNPGNKDHDVVMEDDSFADLVSVSDSQTSSMSSDATMSSSFLDEHSTNSQSGNGNVKIQSQFVSRLQDVVVVDTDDSDVYVFSDSDSD